MTCEELIVKDLCPSNNFQNLNHIYKEDIGTRKQTDFLVYSHKHSDNTGFLTKHAKCVKIEECILKSNP